MCLALTYVCLSLAACDIVLKASAQAPFSGISKAMRSAAWLPGAHLLFRVRSQAYGSGSGGSCEWHMLARACQEPSPQLCLPISSGSITPARASTACCPPRWSRMRCVRGHAHTWEAIQVGFECPQNQHAYVQRHSSNVASDNSRYRCLDCLGPVGWDVCEACYTTGDRQALASSGRFGQSPGHVPDHVIGEVPQDSLSRAIDGLRNVNSGRNSGPADRAQGDRITCNATDIMELRQGTVPRVSLAGAAGEPEYTARNDTASIDFVESAARPPLDSPGPPSEPGTEAGRGKMRDVSWDGGHRLGSRSRAS